VVPIARATFDRCGVVLGGSATLPEAPGRGAYRALGLRGVLMVRGVVLMGGGSRAAGLGADSASVYALGAAGLERGAAFDSESVAAIEEGMTEADVLRLLGEPNDQSKADRDVAWH
jgi:hypothetical protein